MSAPRRRSQSGAAAVEFAILAPLVLAIVFGALSGGLAWNTKQTLTHATREGVRYAATKAPPSDGDWNTWLLDVADRAFDSSFGELNDGQPGRLACVSYIGPSTQRLVISEDDPYSSPPASAYTVGEPCFEDGRPADEPRVQVVLRRETTFIAVLYNRNDLPLESTAVARHEVTST